MDLAIYQVDAFTDRAFAGNPAGVMPLQSWLPDAKMQAIATEMNLAETAFFAPEGRSDDGHYRIRWFTPTVEMPLCGHATLASAHVLTKFLKPDLTRIHFDSKSGPLYVAPQGDMLELDFPAQTFEPRPAALAKVAAAFDIAPVEVFAANVLGIYVALYETEAQVADLRPNMAQIAALDMTVVVTAPGKDKGIDFVSRYFAPQAGIPEDPVTGGTHCILTPFWAGVLGKTKLRARQVSARGGDLWLSLEGDRVKIAGHSVCVIKGTMSV
jgi:PhzF family phenazine biosynthesis protein